MPNRFAQFAPSLPMLKPLLAYCILVACVLGVMAQPVDSQVGRDLREPQATMVQREATERRLSLNERAQLRDQLRQQAIQRP